MRIHRLTWVLAILACALFVDNGARGQTRGYSSEESHNRQWEDVSLVQLIANPSAYDGKNIQVIGYLHLEFEGDALYLHKEDFLVGMSRDAMWVDPPPLSKEQRDALQDHYVICQGVFHSKLKGHMDMFGGTIGSITRLAVWPMRSDIEKIKNGGR